MYLKLKSTWWAASEPDALPAWGETLLPCGGPRAQNFPIRGLMITTGQYISRDIWWALFRRVHCTRYTLLSIFFCATKKTQKMAFWAKYQHFWPIWSNAWPKNNADKLSRWFSVMLVPKLLLTPIKIRIFGPKTAKFGPKYAFLVILGQILAFLAHFIPCPTKKQGAKVYFRYLGTKRGACLV